MFSVQPAQEFLECEEYVGHYGGVRSLTNCMLFSTKFADFKPRTVGVKAAKDSKDSVLMGAKKRI